MTLSDLQQGVAPRREVAIHPGWDYQILIMADTYVPLISSGAAGPLGVVHPAALAESLAGRKG